MCGETEHSSDEKLIRGVNDTSEETGHSDRGEHSGQVDNPDHPGIDGCLIFVEYVVQLIGVFSACPWGDGANQIGATVRTLLFSTTLLAFEFGLDAFDSGGPEAPKHSALWGAFWGSWVLAGCNLALFTFLSCLDVSDISYKIAWSICTFGSVLAPIFMLKYQYERFRIKHPSEGNKEGGVSQHE